MAKAAEIVYGALRKEGTQKSVIDRMQTRTELYEVLGYHEYERKLDELFAREAHSNAPHIPTNPGRERTMSSNETPAAGFKPKKSVALSGVTAGNTALCTVGRSGNDLHYRGYDILDLADSCEFEEVAHLLIHGKLPNRAELAGYKAKLKRLRGLPAPVRAALEALPASSHPMDVLRTGTSVLGCALPEKDDHNIAGARDIADRLHREPRLDAVLLVSLQPLGRAHLGGDRRRLDRRPLPAPAAPAGTAAPRG